MLIGYIWIIQVCFAIPLLPKWLSSSSSSLLSSSISINFGSKDDSRLIKLGPNNYQISTEAEKLYLKRSGINFIDVTEHISIDQAISQGLIEQNHPSGLQKFINFGSKQLKTLKKEIPVYNYPTSPQNHKTVNHLIDQIDIDLVYNNLANFTSFYTRYYKSQLGYDSANWLFALISNYTNSNPDIKLTQFNHKSWDQYSIIVSIPGKSNDKVVVGAHQDSANLLFPNLMKAPGADDDGSGTVTILEALRLIVTNKIKFYNTLEFHFYSAEEGGLLGSIDIFNKYYKTKQIVVGMLQQDMTGYTQGTIDKGIEEHFGLITDYTAVEQNNFIKMIIKHYNSIPYKETECGYACSDFASATENGYPASFIIESQFDLSNKYIHSVMDTIDRLDFNHIKEHIKLTLGYAIELASADNLHKDD
jgi:leucyl aminopeptidase